MSRKNQEKTEKLLQKFKVYSVAIPPLPDGRGGVLFRAPQKISRADIARVRRMFRDELSDYKAKALAIQNTEIFMDEYALSVCNPQGVSSPTIVGAQAANELLNVKNVKASFVCTPYNDQVYISARSIDKVNVQVIMEQFGGGGHMNLAGAQVRNKTTGEVIVMLKKIIEKMIEEGEF